MNHLQYEYALRRVTELHEQAEKERLLRPCALSWRVRSARALHSLVRRLEPEPSAKSSISLP